MNAIATIAPLSFGEIERLAISIAKSNLFGIRTPEQAVVLMMIAQAEGRHPALAARDYDIIQGRPAKKAEAMARDFLEGGGKIEWHALTDSVADATFSHPQGGSRRITWDMERVAKAGLAGKDNYKKFPRQMLRSRVVSEGVRTVWPSATSGMHIPEEVRDIGPIIEHDADAPPPAPTVLGQAVERAYPSRRDEINEAVPLESTPQRTRASFLDSLEIAMRDCGDIDAVNRLIAHPDTQRAMATFTNGHKGRLDGIIAAGIGAHAQVVHEEADGWPGPTPADFARERETTST